MITPVPITVSEIILVPVSERPAAITQVAIQKIQPIPVDVGYSVKPIAIEVGTKLTPILVSKDIEPINIDAQPIAQLNIEIPVLPVRTISSIVIEQATEWFEGNGIPSNLIGKDGDFYLDIDNGDVYQKVHDTWF